MAKMIFEIYILLLTVVLSLFMSTSIAELTEDELSRIDNYITEIMECREIPGSAIVMIRENVVELTRGYGYADLESGALFTETSKIGIGSITKSFTTTLAAKLFQEMDNVDWDTTARDVLGEDFHFSDGHRSNNTKLRDVVSHQMGIPRFDPFALGSVSTREEIVYERIRYMGEQIPMRSDFVYNNNMYNVLAQVLENIHGSTWEELLIEQLFNPLQMTNTTFFNYEQPEYEGFVTPYNLNLTANDPEQLYPSPLEMLSELHVHGPSASVVSTAVDMAKWMQFVLNNGISGGGELIVTPEEMIRLWYPESSLPPSSLAEPLFPFVDSTDTYGLGYFNGFFKGFRKHSHTGKVGGYCSEMYLLPDAKTGTLYMTNHGPNTRESMFINQFLQEILLNQTTTFTASEVCQLLESSTSMRKKSPSKDTLSLDKAISKELLQSLREYDLLTVLKELHGESLGSEYQLTFDAGKILSNVFSSVSQGLNGFRLKEQYFGTYGNFILGNLTISNSEACNDCLSMHYGVNGIYTLYPANNPDIYMAYNIYPFWAFTPVEFSGFDLDGNAGYALPLFFEPALPPYFERGLAMSNAPPPNIDSCSAVNYV